MVCSATKRIVYLDVVKFIAIWLVCIGHSYSIVTMKHSSILYQWIYSFHMPLFMLVSGYLFYGSIRKHLWICNFQSRFTKLLLPIFLWNSLYLIIRNSIDFIDGKPVLLKEEILSYFTALWFLWAFLV